MQGAPPEPNDARERAPDALDEQLDAFEAKRAPKAAFVGGTGGIEEGYRLVAGLIGGVLGGVGLGWFVDHLAHTSPIGLICGLLVGTVVSIVGAMRSAVQASNRAAAKSGPVPPAVADDDDDD